MAQFWLDKRYHSLDYHLKNTFGGKVYKLSVNGGFTCPNRDGVLGSRGCIFCSEGGSGDFAAAPDMSVRAQLDAAKLKIGGKYKGNLFIAYFQAFTNTYAPVSRLRELYFETAAQPDIAAISIATRPDCLSDEIISLLCELNQFKPVWIELGLQTIHQKSAEFIRRGYALPVFTEAVQKLAACHIETIVHVILGLPTETENDMLSTVAWLSSQPIQGIKLQLLHVLAKTDLGDLYSKQPFKIFTLDGYVDLLIRCLEILPPEIVIHRLTGDGPKNLLIAPLWSGNKKKVFNTIQQQLKQRDTWQGRLYTQNNL